MKPIHALFICIPIGIHLSGCCYCEHSRIRGSVVTNNYDWRKDPQDALFEETLNANGDREKDFQLNNVSDKAKSPVSGTFTGSKSQDSTYSFQPADFPQVVPMPKFVHHNPGLNNGSKRQIAATQSTASILVVLGSLMNDGTAYIYYRVKDSTGRWGDWHSRDHNASADDTALLNTPLLNQTLQVMNTPFSKDVKIVAKTADKISHSWVGKPSKNPDDYAVVWTPSSQ